MTWDFSAFLNVGFLVMLAVTVFGIFYTRATKPKPIKRIVVRSKKSDPSLGLLILGGFLGYLIGSSNDDEDANK
jgi:hypothetical protein